MPVEAEDDLVRPRTLVVEGLVVRFGGVTAVDHMSMTVGPGEVVGLIGPNGAGKSTLIDTLSGFVRPTAGSVRLGDEDLTGAPVHVRVRAGLVRSWQSVEVFEDVSVAENLQVGSEQLSWRDRIRDLVVPRKATLDEAARSAAAAFQLESDLQRMPTELSFSQRRMVSTARAVALRPSILLLDEPAAGMSDVRRVELAVGIRSLAEKHGMGVLVVDHDMPFVMDLCDRIVVMNRGAKLAEGSPAIVRSNPGVIAAYLHDDETDDSSPEPAPGAAGVASRPALNGTAEESLIAARNLAVGYYGRPVVEGIHLDLHAGEVVALLGANRAGKTTTLLGLTGVLPPLAGEVSCFGCRVTGRTTPQWLAKRGVGFLSDDRAVFRQLTVSENFRVARCDVSIALELFPELEHRLKTKVGLLSGGEQQMVGLARAMGRHPTVLLVDEMSLGLAPRILRRLMDVLRFSADRYGVGVIVVEQHVSEALRIADSVCVVAGGRMTLRGAVDDVRERVRGAFLADVLGTDPTEEEAR